MRTAHRVRIWWLTTATTAAALETWAVHHPEHQATISHLTRTICHTHTRTGRIVFAAAWFTFTAWYAHHILRRAA